MTITIIYICVNEISCLAASYSLSQTNVGASLPGYHYSGCPVITGGDEGDVGCHLPWHSFEVCLLDIMIFDISLKKSKAKQVSKKALITSKSD